MRREQMGHCDPSSFGTVTKTAPQQAGETPASANCSPSMFFVWPLFGHVSWELQGFLHHRFVRISRLCFAFCILRCSLRSCSSEAQAAMAERASAPVPALKSHRSMPQHFPLLIMNDGTGLGWNVLPRNQWLLTVVHHLVAHRCSSFSYIFPMKHCYVGLQPIFRHTHVSPRRQQTTRSRVQWS